MSTGAPGESLPPVRQTLVTQLQRHRKENRLLVFLALAVLVVWSAVSVLRQRAEEMDPATITRGLVLFVLSYLNVTLIDEGLLSRHEVAEHAATLFASLAKKTTTDAMSSRTTSTFCAGIESRTSRPASSLQTSASNDAAGIAITTWVRRVSRSRAGV